MSTVPMRLFSALTACALVLYTPVSTNAASFVFAGESNGVDIITHVHGYTGAGGNLNITVGIDPSSANAAAMVLPLQNVIRVFNALEPTTNNLQSANVPFSQYDFESILLHEMGHALGLGHCNLATESGLGGSSQNYTKSTDGGNNSYNLDDGADNIIGSGDDGRGDDVNMNWFRTATNNPASFPPTIDSTTFSRNTANLPGGHTFAANGDRTVMANLGYANTEAVMQQGTFNGEAQRTLLAEDITALRIAMAGLDEVQGTSDDYTFTLTYAGLTTSANIVVDFDTSTGFAVTQNTGVFIGATDHVRLDGNPTRILFNPNAVTWFFNDVSNEADPNNVYVGFNAGSNGVGTEVSPFDNLTDAVSFANSGADVHLEPGSSTETFSGGSAISKVLTLRNNNPGGGTVTIGN